CFRERRGDLTRPRHQRELAPGVPVGPIPPTTGRFAPESGLRGTLWEFTLSPSPARKLTAPPLAARNGAESGRAARAAADAWRSQQAAHLQHYICAWRRAARCILPPKGRA